MRKFKVFRKKDEKKIKKSTGCCFWINDIYFLHLVLNIFTW